VQVIVTARSLIDARLFGGRRSGAFVVTFAKAFATEQEDLGVFDQTIGDRSGDGGVVEDVAPVGKCCVGGDDGRALLAVASGDDLIEKIRALLIEREVT
jgi:hypothetical protein